ncbi:MAG: bifunctional diaminohydroxyphosphoribosylaminopyrimidine deaminase/5-amino-6-(5-phosphoribosylamino)uracil reductase RibD, partial [Planctomycetaceae bacterium]
TPPCVDAVLAAGVRRVVVAMADPNPLVNGRGLQLLKAAGVSVELGLLAGEAADLTAPFLQLMTTGRPWIHAKWAMTLDGKIASRSGESKWISNPASRALTHQLRGRMDAIVVGIGTALADDPLLTARPPGPRSPARVILDSHARLPLTSQLVRSVGSAPLLVAVAPSAPAARIDALRNAGAEILVSPAQGGTVNENPGRIDLAWLFQELGRQRRTNVLVEGGGAVLGALHDQDLIDEFHVFVAPRLLGGEAARSPLLGHGRQRPSPEGWLQPWTVESLDGDVYLHCRVATRQQPERRQPEGGHSGRDSSPAADAGGVA